MVGARDEADVEPEEEGGGLHPDDEAAIEAINRLVQQLFREDEYVWPSAVGKAGDGASQRDARPNAAPGDEAGTGLVPGGVSSGRADPGPQKAPIDETLIETRAGKMDKAALKAEARSQRFATVPAGVAKAKAEAVARGTLHTAGLEEGELTAVVTRVPDWTEADPELPEGWVAGGTGKVEGGSGAANADAR